MKNKTGLKRELLDKFYTSPHIVIECIKNIKENLEINKNDLCIEPSAGNGAFINGIKSMFKFYKFYDLKPENEEVIKQDYLDFQYENIHNNKYNKKHIVGNPPFGRQSSLAIKFIKQSCKYAESVSFILPKSFKKDSLKDKVPLNFHCVYEYDLPVNSFMLNGNDHDVPCVFQIWVKKDTLRKKTVKLIPNGYTFVKKICNHDVSFRRVGGNAGNISTDTDDKSIQSHYFIKFNDNILNNDSLQKIKNINFLKSSDTVGPKSISKQELIKEFNMVL